MCEFVFRCTGTRCRRCGRRIDGNPLDLPPISMTIRLIALTTPRAASWKGTAAAISLLPRPRGRSVARCVGIVSGISGWPADTTQIGKRLPMAQATSMPT
jgi:hypothetical protein